MGRQNRLALDVSPSTDHLRFSRILMAVAGFGYLCWWLMVRVLLPGSFNPIGSRVAVVLFCWVILAGTYFSGWLARHASLSLSACLWLLTFHYFYLFHHNEADINWVVGCYITVIAANACLRSEAEYIAYSIWVVALSTALAFYDTTLLHTVFLPGILTIVAFAYLGLHARKISEKDRIKYEASERALKLRDDFLSIASHELKTPLTNIKMQTQMALRGIRKNDPVALAPERMRHLVEQTDRQADRLTRLVEEMLDVSKISSGNLSIEREDFDLVALVDDVAAAFDSALKHAGESLRVDGPEQATVYADRPRIEQVVSNLLSNAIKYGDRKPIRIAIEQQSGETRLAFEDQGIGVSPENQARIFDRFERAISFNEISGLGLGLYVAKNIVQAHGGRIEVASQSGQGSRFTVILPTEKPTNGGRKAAG